MLTSGNRSTVTEMYGLVRRNSAAMSATRLPRSIVSTSVWVRPIRDSSSRSRISASM